MSEKKCSACKVIKPISDFYKHPRTVDGYCHWCKACILASNRRWRQNNVEKDKLTRSLHFQTNKERILAKRRERHKLAPHVRAGGRRRRVYGLKESEYEEMLTKQSGCCAICNKKARLNVDHCHTTGKVRGLLCFSCNAGIGLLQDDVKLLESAVAYLLASGLTLLDKPVPASGGDIMMAHAKRSDAVFSKGF